MKKKALILGIESSCDETAASVIEENHSSTPKILSNVVSSQIDVHKEFGGVVPELAARSHIEKIDLIVEKAIKQSGKKIENIDAVAATAGPGLIVCLSVGLNFGKALASSLKKPFIAINHLEGHALSPKLVYKLDYPYLLLLISANFSKYGPPGNSIPKSFAVLSNASPTASSIVVPNLLYFPKPFTAKY